MSQLKVSSLVDEKGMILPELISYDGEMGLENLIAELQFSRPKGEQPKIEKLNINQLRKYYDAFLRIYNNSLGEKEKKILLLMLKANAEYSAKRIYVAHFSEFFSNRINLVVNQTGILFTKNLNALKLHLEALVAYFPKQ